MSAQDMTAADVLRKALALIEPPGAWTQASYARDLDRNPVKFESPWAVCWCVSGALRRASGYLPDTDDGFPASLLDACAALIAVTGHDITGWNDVPGRTQAEACDAFRRAIAKAEGV